MAGKNIYQKLVTIQSMLKAPKGQYNSFGKYNYRSCEDILEGLKPILKDIEAVILLTDEIIQIGERYYVKATVTLIDSEAGGSISVSSLAREDDSKKGMDAAQVTGSTSSYARKYALNGLFCIDDTKDSDSANQHGKEEKQSPPQAQPNKDNVLVLVKEYASKAGMSNTDIGELIKTRYEKSYKELSSAEKSSLLQHLKELAGA